jgi:cytidylate kinase
LDDAAEPRRRLTYRALADRLARIEPIAPARCIVVGIDGWSGAGKSFFADRLCQELGAALIRTDDVMPGWDSLARTIDLLERWILIPLAAGRPAVWRRFDWDLMRAAEWAEVAPTRTLVIEGCGIGHRRLAPYLSYLIWVSAPAQVRRTRLPGREDWEMYRPFVDMFAAQERALRAGDDPEQRADLLVCNDASAEGPTRPAGDREPGFVVRTRDAPGARPAPPIVRHPA